MFFFFGSDYKVGNNCCCMKICNERTANFRTLLKHYNLVKKKVYSLINGLTFLSH